MCISRPATSLGFLVWYRFVIKPSLSHIFCNFCFSFFCDFLRAYFASFSPFILLLHSSFLPVSNGSQRIFRRSLFVLRWAKLESLVSIDDFCALRRAYNIPQSVVLEIPGRHVVAVDSDGMASRVALYPLMLTNDLHLLLCCLIRDVLNFLGLALAQLHLNAWRLLVANCVIFCRVLSFGSEEYLDLTVWEFLSVYRVLCLDGSLCSFQARSSEKRIANLEKRHSHLKDISHKRCHC